MQTLGLGFHILDVHVRDAAVLQLALCDRDLHAAPLQTRPASLPVHVGLLEPELLAVERAARVEVLDPVPDGHGLPGASAPARARRRRKASQGRTQGAFVAGGYGRD